MTPREYRQTLGISRVDWATILGASARTVRRIECGQGTIGIYGWERLLVALHIGLRGMPLDEVKKLGKRWTLLVREGKDLRVVHELIGLYLRKNP